MEEPQLVQQISIIIAQSFYPYGESVWRVTGKGTRLKCENLAKEIIDLIRSKESA